MPGAFCAGTDLADLATVPGEVRGLRGSAEERHKWWPIAQARKPTIGAIDGPAVGMGAEFSSQCDLRLASTNARFAWNFVHRGLVPDTGAGTWLLPRIIGVQPALKLLYTGEMIDAAEALRLGYVLDVISSDDVLPTGDGVGELDRRWIAPQPGSHQVAGPPGPHRARGRTHGAAHRGDGGLLQER